MGSESLFPNDPSCSTCDELIDRRTAALHKAECEDLAAAETRRQSEMYVSAAIAAGERSFRAEALAKQFVVNGETKSAAEQRNLAAELRATREESYETAEDKGRRAMEHQCEAFNARSLALRLDAQLKKERELGVKAYHQATREEKGSSLY